MILTAYWLSVAQVEGGEKVQYLELESINIDIHEMLIYRSTF